MLLLLLPSLLPRGQQLRGGGMGAGAGSLEPRAIGLFRLSDGGINGTWYTGLGGTPSSAPNGSLRDLGAGVESNAPFIRVRRTPKFGGWSSWNDGSERDDGAIIGRTKTKLVAPSSAAPGALGESGNETKSTVASHPLQ